MQPKDLGDVPTHTSGVAEVQLGDEAEKGDKQEKDGKKKEEKPETVGLFELYKFSDTTDKLVLALGVVMAITCGSLFSVMYIMFGDVTQALATYQLPAVGGEDKDKIFLEAVIKFAVEISLLGLGIWISHYIFVTAFNFSAERQVLRVRKEFLKAVLRQDLEWFDTNNTSDFATKLTEDLNKMEDGMGEKVGMLLRFIFAGLTAFIYPFIENWLLSLVLLSLVPILAIMGGAMGKVMTSVSKDELANYGAAGAIAEEVLAAIRTVVAFGGQEKEQEKYNKEVANARKNAFVRGSLTATTMGLMFGVIYGMYGLGLWYGIKLILDDRESPEYLNCSTRCIETYGNTTTLPDYTDHLTECLSSCFRFSPGSVVVCVFGVLQGGMGMGQAGPYGEALGLAMASAAKVFKVIAREPAIDSSSEEGMKPATFGGNIKFRGVNFSYPSRKDIPVLKDFSLDIEKGKTVALVGASGCGKSTCVQLVQRLYDPHSGTITLDGVDLKELNVGWLRRNIGVVGQEPVLFDCSIRENICYAKKDATEEEIVTACKEANAFDFISRLPQQLDTLVGEGGAQLSGGQKQRIAIARALVRLPSLLLLDEATSALDTESEAIVQEALDRIHASRTTIVIAHRLSTVRNADMIVALEEGKVKEKGTHEELMELGGLYRSLVERQLAGKEEVGDGRRKMIDNHLERSAPGRFSTRQMSKQASVTGNPSVEEYEDDKKELKTGMFTLFKRLLAYNKPELPWILLGVVFAFGFAVASPFFAVIFGDFLEGLGMEDIAAARSKSVRDALMMAAVGLLFFVAVGAQGVTFSYSGAMLVERLRVKMFKKIMENEMGNCTYGICSYFHDFLYVGWFDRQENNTGALCSRLSSNAEAVSTGTGAKVGQVVSGISTLLFSNLLAIYYDWRLGLVGLLFNPPLVLGMLLQMRMMSANGPVQKDALEKSSKVAVESITNIRTVAGLTCEGKIYDQFAAALEEPHKSVAKRAHIRGLIFGMTNSLFFLAYGLLFYYGAWLITNDSSGYLKENPMSIWRATIAALQGGMFAGMSFSSLMDVQKMFLAAERIFELLDRDTPASPGSHPLSKIEGNVALTDAQFSYPTRQDVQVLKKLSLAISAGQKVALVGQSGCGKSTVIQLVQRFYDLDSGVLQLESTDITKLNREEVRSKLGIVSQEPVLFNRSIAENIRYGDNGREASMEDVIAAAKKSNIHSFVAALPEGYETNVGAKGTQLSGGQKQRVAIARAMLRDPAILLLDEATSALDSESEKVVQEALEVNILLPNSIFNSSFQFRWLKRAGRPSRSPTDSPLSWGRT